MIHRNCLPLVVLSAGLGFGGDTDKAKATLRTAVVERRDIAETGRATGTLEPEEMV